MRLGPVFYYPFVTAKSGFQGSQLTWSQKFLDFTDSRFFYGFSEQFWVFRFWIARSRRKTDCQPIWAVNAGTRNLFSLLWIVKSFSGPAEYRYLPEGQFWIRFVIFAMVVLCLSVGGGHMITTSIFIHQVTLTVHTWLVLIIISERTNLWESFMGWVLWLRHVWWEKRAMAPFFFSRKVVTNSYQIRSYGSALS